MVLSSDERMSRTYPARSIVFRLLATAWLGCQLLAFSAPVLVDPSALAASEQCTCPGGTLGAQCPMHHRALDQNASGPRMRSSCASSDVALLSLAAAIAVLPQTADFGIDVVSSAVRITPVPSQSRVELPGTPPPRA
jgi:hypothetical protein